MKKYYDTRKTFTITLKLTNGAQENFVSDGLILDLGFCAICTPERIEHQYALKDADIINHWLRWRRCLCIFFNGRKAS